MFMPMKMILLIRRIKWEWGMENGELEIGNWEWGIEYNSPCPLVPLSPCPPAPCPLPLLPNNYSLSSK
jgi:hypothetical protein